MTIVWMYAACTLAVLLILLHDRFRVRQQGNLRREDMLTSLCGAISWPVLALIYVSVASHLLFVRRVG